MQKFEPSYLTSLNRRTVRALAESFVMQPGEYMPWLIECCSSSNLSKPLFLLVILQSFILQKEGIYFIYVSVILLLAKASIFCFDQSSFHFITDACATFLLQNIGCSVFDF